METDKITEQITLINTENVFDKISEKVFDNFLTSNKLFLNKPLIW